MVLNMTNMETVNNIIMEIFPEDMIAMMIKHPVQDQFILILREPLTHNEKL